MNCHCKVTPGSLFDLRNDRNLIPLVADTNPRMVPSRVLTMNTALRSVVSVTGIT